MKRVSSESIGNFRPRRRITLDAMPWITRLAADLVVIAHASYVLFVLVGQLLILLGWLSGWQWVRNRWFRGTHLTAIGIVVVESWVGITCPLTTLEYWLRSRAGETTYRGSFLGDVAHDLLFVDWSPWVFTLIYTLFGLLVVLTLIFVPPRWKSVVRRSASHSTPRSGVPQ